MQDVSSLTDPARMWASGSFNAPGDLVPFNAAIGTLITVDEDGLFEVLGTAVVASAQKRTAVCLGAAHSFDQIKERQQRRSGVSTLNVPPQFRIVGPTYVDPTKIHAFFRGEGDPIVCRLGQLHYMDGYDVALFTVHAPEDAPNFDAQLAVDFAMPEVGEELVVLAHNMAIRANHFDASKSSIELATRLELRWLGDEVFEYLLGCRELDASSRNRLWKTKSRGGFEAALAETPIEQRGLLESAIAGMFNQMNQSFEANFEFTNYGARHVSTFLSRFTGAIDDHRAANCWYSIRRRCLAPMCR